MKSEVIYLLKLFITELRNEEKNELNEFRGKSVKIKMSEQSSVVTLK